MNRPQVLVVDDEADIRELLEITLSRMDVDATSVATLEAAREAAQQREFDLCLTDMRLPDGNGLDLVRYMSQRNVPVPIAMITAYGSMDTAIAALKAGAFDFISKPVDLSALRALVGAALRLSSQADAGDHRLIGSSDVMRETRETIAKLARSQAPVCISGESGTGKELAARLIHDQGPRAEQPFVPVNCGAIPAELMESELFGHKRGSFTGAISDRSGLFQAADGGTLFLDEVADLPIAMQVKLLRAIQEKAVRPVGAPREVAVDVRILSASHHDLAGLVEAGRFRQDLYYRLDVINLRMPSLRERPGDIPELCEYIIARLDPSPEGERAIVSAEAIQALARHEFRGNVRELENLLERALALCEGKSVGPADLGLDAAEPVAAPAGDHGGEPGDLDSVLERVEKETILGALEGVRWNKTAAAKQLGISFGALRYRMQKLGLD